MFDPNVFNGRALLDEPEALMGSFDAASPVPLDFEYIVSQAQKRLSSRTEAELIAGATHLRELTLLADKKGKENQRKAMFAGSATFVLNDPIAIIDWFREHDLSDQPDFPDATPIEYVALLALAYALESMDAAEQAIRYGEGDSQDALNAGYKVHFENVARSKLEDGKELIAFIYGIEFQQLFSEKAGRLGRKVRNRRYDNLKRKILDYVDQECSALNNRKASQVANLYFQDEVEDVMKNNEEPEQQIAKWIGEHRRKSKQ